VTGLTPLLPFAILGAVIMDADIFFSLISDSNPPLYLFTHGGIAHSLAGAHGLVGGRSRRCWPFNRL
jgi:inner membrane protein